MNSARAARGRGRGRLPFAHNAESLAAVQIWNLTTRHGDLDLSFVPQGTEGYEDLVREATDTPIMGVTVRLPHWRT